ncbi:hypothetical protein NMY22_g17404 [Coprinellus aureogranulatus]|nr:hypothetical protein NMY22_g17404 [Coprinellus aureogranulatus]
MTPRSWTCSSRSEFPFPVWLFASQLYRGQLRPIFGGPIPRLVDSGLTVTGARDEGTGASSAAITASTIRFALTDSHIDYDGAAFFLTSSFKPLLLASYSDTPIYPIVSSSNMNEEENVTQRPPSPPPHTTFEARGIHPPTFSALKPRDYRLPGSQAYTHVAWSCDGKRLAAVGVEKTTRIWNPDKSIEYRSATAYSGGHTDEVDYISWNPTHPDLFCTSSQRDRRIVFWDARQSRNIQVYLSKYSPVQTAYSPNGRELLGISATNALFFMNLGRDKPEEKEQWRSSDREPVRDVANSTAWKPGQVLTALHTESSIRAIEYPSLALHKTSPAHVGGVTALALDPRGRYLASGGIDSIVNLFDLEDWISAKTITSCEHSINSLSFSHDGEYLAVSTTGPYVDICATETGLSMHRVPAPAPAPVVAWHPSRYVVAYCGQTTGPPAVSTISLFGLLE